VKDVESERRLAIFDGMIFLGLDVGFSLREDTSAVCTIAMRGSSVEVESRRCGNGERRVTTALKDLLGPGGLAQAAAIDGPLVRNPGHTTYYRLADKVLSRGAFQKRCKPGQTSAPVGQSLHHMATEVARPVGTCLDNSAAGTDPRITTGNLYEAFPNAFLGVMLPDRCWPEQPVGRRRKGDALWNACLGEGKLDEAFRVILGHAPKDDLRAATWNRDERSAVICGLTAAAGGLGKCVAVGDCEKGYIFLPPRELWEDWALATLDRNYSAIRGECHEGERWLNGNRWH